MWTGWKASPWSSMCATRRERRPIWPLDAAKTVKETRAGPSDSATGSGSKPPGQQFVNQSSSCKQVFYSLTFRERRLSQGHSCTSSCAPPRQRVTRVRADRWRDRIPARPRICSAPLIARGRWRCCRDLRDRGYCRHLRDRRYCGRRLGGGRRSCRGDLGGRRCRGRHPGGRRCCRRRPLRR